MKISTEFLTDYLLEKDMGWEDFQAFSTMAIDKKDIIIANWRFGDTLDSETVKKIFTAFEGISINNTPVEGLSFDDFIKDYQNKNDHQF